MKDINIEAILNKHSFHFESFKITIPRDGKKGSEYDRMKAAIKGIVEAVIDKCAEEVDYLEVYNPHISDIPKEAGQLITTYYNPNGADIGYYLDKESILKVKEMINY